uniref:Sen15 protein n=1 Tax=Siphoviridae sp. cty3u30 TaxID=2825744 RepID=A0A8S5Q8E5_9CAUD|nr:MAG TPA: Sen15 protein [Siphoviridae sp. cty3u30]
MAYTYRTYEDNAGSLHLAILDDDDRCVYYLVSADRKLINDTIDALEDGGDPIEDGWDGSEEAPPEVCLSEIEYRVDLCNGSAYQIDG